MIKKIKGIEVVLSEHNRIHTTTEDLICDLCGRNAESVMAIHPPRQKLETKLACFDNQECFVQLMENMFSDYDDEYLFICLIRKVRK